MWDLCPLHARASRTWVLRALRALGLHVERVNVLKAGQTAISDDDTVTTVAAELFHSDAPATEEIVIDAITLPYDLLCRYAEEVNIYFLLTAVVIGQFHSPSPFGWYSNFYISSWISWSFPCCRNKTTAAPMRVRYLPAPQPTRAATRAGPTLASISPRVNASISCVHCCSGTCIRETKRRTSTLISLKICYLYPQFAFCRPRLGEYRIAQRDSGFRLVH